MLGFLINFYFRAGYVLFNRKIYLEDCEKYLNKALILICIMLFSAMLSGFDKRTVELQNNSNMPLIDLDKAIDRAKWGTDSDSAAGSDASSSETVSADGASDGAVAGLANVDKELIIKVRGKSINLNGTELKNSKELKKKLAAEYKKGDTVQVKDDYADADTYREVLELLRALAETEGLVYSGDYVER